MSRYKLCTLPTPSSSSGAIKARPVIGDRSERLNRHVGSRSDGLRPSQFFSLLLGMGNEVRPIENSLPVAGDSNTAHDGALLYENISNGV